MELRQGPLRLPLRPQEDRLTTPLVRDEETGRHRPGVVARGVRRRGAWPTPRDAGVGVLTGGRLTGEDAYAYSKFARVALGTNDIDFRARPHSAEEAEFLASHVVGKALDVTYADLERAASWCSPGSSPRRRVADRVLAAAQGRPQREPR